MPHPAQDPSEVAQFSTFKDCVARRVLLHPSMQADPQSPDLGSSSDPVDDFTTYLAEEIWPSLPSALRDATHETRDTVPDVDDLPLDAISASFTETLVSYGLVEDADSAVAFLRRALRDYVSLTCAPPPVWSRTRTTECEICEREVPLTYHHLIPREVHDKVLKKKWHPPAMVNSVAWLCRPCHTAVHQVASNEELAREYYTVDLLLAREDIQKWRKYASKQRFGVRRG